MAHGRTGSSPVIRTSSSQATYRLRRAFSFYYKAHRALILLFLASKPDPLSLGSDLDPPLCGGFVWSREDIDFNLPFQKERHDQRSCLSFWVSPPEGRRHPSAIQMLGGSEFRLCQGFRLQQKTLCAAKAAPARRPGLGSISSNDPKAENIDFDRPLQVRASVTSLVLTFYSF